MEIGSEFWLDKIPEESINDIPNWLTKYGNTTLTSSGRGAISLLLQQLIPNSRSVLLPAYICDSVIIPFIENGYTCYFYDVNEDFSPKIECIKSYKNVGIFLHMGYYGFQTNSNLLSIIRYLKKQSTIIIEDITHTLFSQFDRFEENDIYIGSIRKWFGIPSGGFISSFKGKLKMPVACNNEFIRLRTAGLVCKGKYIETVDESLKSDFLEHFSNAEVLLDKDVNPYRIDNLSLSIINLLDVQKLISRRRENFKVLMEGLRHIDYLETPFNNLTKNECPMFYPIIVKKNRDDLRKKLINEKIYCPIHWPIPNQIEGVNYSSTLDLYNSLLSIPCDQRYEFSQMERIIKVLKSI